MSPRKPRRFGCYDYWSCLIRSTPILEALWPLSSGGLRTTVRGLHLEYKLCIMDLWLISPATSPETCRVISGQLPFIGPHQVLLKRNIRYHGSSIKQYHGR